MIGCRQFWIFAGQKFWQCFQRDYSVTIKSHGAQTSSSLVSDCLIVWLVIVGQGKINGDLCYNKSPTPHQKILHTCVYAHMHTPHTSTQDTSSKRQFLLQAYFLIQKQNKNLFIILVFFFILLLHGRLLVTAPPCSHRHTKSSTASKGGWTHLCRPPPLPRVQTPSERQ